MRTRTCLFEEATQGVADVTVTVSVVIPAFPAVHVTVAALSGDVNVPFAIVQAYVAPAPASGTLALCDVVRASTAAGVVIAADGGVHPLGDAVSETSVMLVFVGPFDAVRRKT